MKKKKKETKKKILIRFGAEIWNLATAQIVLQGCVVGWEESVLQEVLDCIVA